MTFPECHLKSLSSEITRCFLDGPSNVVACFTELQNIAGLQQRDYFHPDASRFSDEEETGEENEDTGVL
jgi:hypothetical protein